nr:hypothetical protein [Tessaracoccus coleopterorum]
MRLLRLQHLHPGEAGDGASSSYLQAVRSELDLAAAQLGSRPVETVFFGGGTPTWLPEPDLAGILAAISERFELAPGAEVTTEANPETVTPPTSLPCVSMASPGSRSASNRWCRACCRSSNADTARTRPGGRRLGPRRGLRTRQPRSHLRNTGESLDDWATSLDAVTGTPVDHVSAYSLIVEEGTRLAMQVRRGEVPMPDDDDLADKYLMAERVLASLGSTTMR